VANIAVMILGQLRTIKHAKSFNLAYPGVTKHIYANVERFNSKTKSYLSQNEYSEWVNIVRPDWITHAEYTPIRINCSNTTDASLHWPQYERMYDTFEAVRQHEIFGEYRYKWIIRLRSDLLHTPPLTLNFSSLVDKVHINGAWHNWGKDRKPEHYLPRDYYFVVPRLKADSFFSLGLDFVSCQSPYLNMKACQVSKWLLFPECLLKTHLIVCDIPFKIF